MTAIAAAPRKTKPVLTNIKPRSGTLRAWKCTLRAAGVIKKRLLELGGKEFKSSFDSCQLAVEFEAANGAGKLRLQIIEHPDRASNLCSLFGRFESATTAQLTEMSRHGIIPGANLHSGKWNHHFYLTQEEVEGILYSMTVCIPQITGTERPDTFEEPRF